MSDALTRLLRSVGRIGDYPATADVPEVPADREATPVAVAGVLADMVAELAAVRAKRARLDCRNRELRAAILQHLEVWEVDDPDDFDGVDEDGERVFTVRVSPRRTLDGRRLKAEWPDLYEEFSSVKDVVYLKVEL